MRRFLLRRSLQSLLLLALVSMIGFTILHLTPGGPVSMFTQTALMTQADLDRIAHQLGVDRPLPVQYADWLWRLLRGDWGHSYRDQQAVLGTILSHLGATLELMLTATVLAVLIGGWIGVMSAVRRYSLFDTLATIGAMIALSIPTFWFGLVMIYIFSIELAWLPPGNQYDVGDASLVDLLKHLILPATVLALVSTATWSRYTRASVIDVMHQDYIRTARSKGIPERRILVHHTVRNALLPMITVAGLQLPALLSGALITETVFTWPGMGRLFLDSIGYRDYPMVMGVLMFTAIMVLLGNLMADVMYGVADPRIRRD